MAKSLAAIACAIFVTGVASAQEHTWRVRNGEALSVLADRFGVSVAELREWNALEGDRINIGQELIVGRENAEGATDGQSYTIVEGDTLSDVAVRFGVTVDDLCRWNDDLDPDRIAAGQTIQLGPARHRIEHQVRRGDSLARIAQRYGVALSLVRRWNANLRGDRLREGRTVVVYTAIPESVSQSVGYPFQGRLEDAVRLPRHPGYFIRERDRAWATLETATWLTEAFDELRAAHPDAPRVRIHDISFRHGGYMEGHRSHQSGRDVDISLFQHGGCDRDEGCAFGRVTAGFMHAPMQWALLRSWLRRDRVEAIFIDYELQAPLYEAARASGATREELHRWFQYPRGSSFPLGIVRHYPEHRDHVHVRFRCDDSDEDCH
jgi:LysM repeat protein